MQEEPALEKEMVMLVLQQLQQQQMDLALSHHSLHIQ
jgi:hypothetical protein